MTPSRPSARVVLRDAVGLTLLSVVAGLVGALGVGLLVYQTPVPEWDSVVVFQSRGLQYGFLALALAYLARRGTDRYLRLRRPTLRDVGWVAAVPVLILVAYVPIGYALELVGLPAAGASGGEVTLAVLDRPYLWPAVLVAYVLVGAPAEELLFRGVIQGRLREHFDPAAGVALAAGCFALMHLFVFLLDGEALPDVVAGVIGTFVAGLAFGVAYERTDFLAVPALAHALFWLAGPLPV